MPTRDIDAGFLERYQSSHDRGIILEALESYSFPESFRKNIRQPGDKNSVFGMCLGLTSWHHLPDRISKHTRGSPRLTELLCAFARWELPSFPFTSIQVNKDYAAALHMDANDVGTSHIIALGDFVGGELWVSNAGRRGREVSINGNWFELDGGLPHCVLPFQGRRYSLVYFNRASCSEGFADQRGSKLAKDLTDLKFPIPMHAIIPISHPPRKERMDTARNKLRIYMDYIAKRGGAGRVLFHLRDPGGQTLKAAVRPDEPLSRLIEAIAQRKQQPPGAVELRLQRLRLMPGDTILNLGLDPRKYVVDIVISNSRSAEASQALQSASSAQALADAMELTNSMEEAHSVQSSPCTPTSAAPRKLHVLPEVSTPPKHIRGSSEFGADIDRRVNEKVALLCIPQLVRLRDQYRGLHEVPASTILESFDNLHNSRAHCFTAHSAMDVRRHSHCSQLSIFVRRIGVRCTNDRTAANIGLVNAAALEHNAFYTSKNCLSISSKEL